MRPKTHTQQQQRAAAIAASHQRQTTIIAFCNQRKLYIYIIFQSRSQSLATSIIMIITIYNNSTITHIQYSFFASIFAFSENAKCVSGRITFGGLDIDVAARRHPSRVTIKRNMQTNWNWGLMVDFFCLFFFWWWCRLVIKMWLSNSQPLKFLMVCMCCETYEKLAGRGLCLPKRFCALFSFRFCCCTIFRTKKKRIGAVSVGPPYPAVCLNCKFFMWFLPCHHSTTFGPIITLGFDIHDL